MGVFGCLFVVLFGFCPRRTRVSVGVVVAVLGALLWKDRIFDFLHYAPFPGGNDGLTHESFGQLIAEALTRGDGREFLRGAEDVFYYMPGLRYWRAFETLIFGHARVLTLLAVALIPLLLERLFRGFMGAKMSMLLAATFALTALWPLALWEGWSYGTVLYLAAAGYAESLALFFLLLFALVACVQKPSVAAAWGMGFAGALALWLRPNVAAAVALGGLCWAATQWRARGFRLSAPLLVSSAAGVSLSLGMLLHNIVFGESWALFTSSAGLPVNSPVRPGEYLLFLKGAADVSLVARIADHLRNYMAPSFLSSWGLALGLLVFLRPRPLDPRARILLAMGVGMLAPTLFFRNKFRHVLPLLVWGVILACTFWSAHGPLRSGFASLGPRAKPRP